MKNVYITILFLALSFMGFSQANGPTIIVSGACYGFDLSINGVEYHGSTFFECWDTNGNGIADANEDTNGDGVVNSADCAGGLLCWDTNGNGVGDPAEDVNNDGVFNVHDCPDCWDTNFNGVMDPDEDANFDGLWNTDDCVVNTNDGCSRDPLTDVTLVGSNSLEILDDPMQSLNGTTGVDLVNIRKWLILGFPGNYEAIAADFDGDGTVSTSDVRDLRRYIIGIDLFPQYNHYFAVLDGTIFPDVDPFDQNVDYSNLTFADSDVENNELNLFVFRAGDVDQSALFRDDVLEGRSKTALSFEDITMEAGKSYTVQFNLTDDNGILGSTFRLKSSKLEIESFASQDDIVYHNESNQIGISYVEYESQDVVTFELTLVATEDAILSELISLDEDFLKEAIDSNLGTSTLSLNPIISNTKTVLAGDINYYPNPVDEVLSIEFPSSEEKVVTLASISGQRILSYTISSERLDIPRTAAMQAGLYLLTVDSSEGTATYKLFYR